MKLLRALEKPLKRLGVERAACIVCLLAVTACYLGMQPGGDLMAQTRTRELPVYFIAGAKDPVGNNGKGVRKVVDLFKQYGMQNVQCKLYPYDRHEILNELDRYMVYEDVRNWLEEVIQNLRQKKEMDKQ